MSGTIHLLFPFCSSSAVENKPDEQSNCGSSATLHLVVSVAMAVLTGAVVTIALYFLTGVGVMYAAITGAGSAALTTLTLYVILRCALGQRAQVLADSTSTKGSHISSKHKPGVGDKPKPKAEEDNPNPKAEEKPKPTVEDTPKPGVGDKKKEDVLHPEDKNTESTTTTGSVTDKDPSTPTIKNPNKIIYREPTLAQASFEDEDSALKWKEAVKDIEPFNKFTWTIAKKNVLLRVSEGLLVAEILEEAGLTCEEVPSRPPASTKIICQTRWKAIAHFENKEAALQWKGEVEYKNPFDKLEMIVNSEDSTISLEVRPDLQKRYTITDLLDSVHLPYEGASSSPAPQSGVQKLGNKTTPVITGPGQIIYDQNQNMATAHFFVESEEVALSWTRDVGSKPSYNQLEMLVKSHTVQLRVRQGVGTSLPKILEQAGLPFSVTAFSPPGEGLATTGPTQTNDKAKGNTTTTTSPPAVVKTNKVATTPTEKTTPIPQQFPPIVKDNKTVTETKKVEVKTTTIPTQGPFKVTYLDKFQATAEFKSRDECLAWKRMVQGKAPYDQLVFDRDGDCESNIIFRVQLGYQTEGGYNYTTITDVLKEAKLSCEDTPAPTIPYSMDEVLTDKSKEYKIDGRIYTIQCLISENGSYGDVYLANDVQAGSLVAIKVLRHDHDEEAVEMEKMNSLGGHPNIVKYIGHGQVMGKTWIVMEYIDGKLRREFEKDNKWTADLEIQYQEAIKFMAKARVYTERENERENILVRTIKDKHIVKLIDFGTLARK